MIFFEKRYARDIVDLFEKRIDTKMIRGWKKISGAGEDEEYESTSSQWSNRARFRAVVQTDGLLMKLLIEDEVEDPRACYAQLHASLLGDMLQHCSEKLFKIEVSADPGFGDTEFD